MTINRGGTCGTNDGPQHPRRHDYIVRIAEHRDEVGHQVERQRQIAEKESQPSPDATRQRLVARQTAKQPDHVGNEPLRVAEAHLLRAKEHQRHEKRGPQHRDAHRHADKDPDDDHDSTSHISRP